jgi:ureidoglycolate hydrolase
VRDLIGSDDPEAGPALESVRAFAVPGGCAINLHHGAWHAGPYFAGDEMSFFNLEFNGTNEIDHQNSSLEQRFGRTLTMAFD